MVSVLFHCSSPCLSFPFFWEVKNGQRGVGWRGNIDHQSLASLLLFLPPHSCTFLLDCILSSLAWSVAGTGGFTEANQIQGSSSLSFWSDPRTGQAAGLRAKFRADMLLVEEMISRQAVNFQRLEWISWHKWLLLSSLSELCFSLPKDVCVFLKYFLGAVSEM